MLWLFVGPTGFTCWISFAPLLLSPYLCFISLLYLDLYVLVDDALIKPQLHCHDFGLDGATTHPDLSSRDASA